MTRAVGLSTNLRPQPFVAPDCLRQPVNSSSAESEENNSHVAH